MRLRTRESCLTVHDVFDVLLVRQSRNVEQLVVLRSYSVDFDELFPLTLCRVVTGDVVVEAG